MIKLVVVDDDVIFTRVLKRAMPARGYDVRVCHTISAGREVAAGGWADVALLDLNIHGENGTILTGEFLATNSSAKIVILSAYGCPKSAVWAARQGAVDFISKPIDADGIDFVLKRALNIPTPMPDQPLLPQEVREVHIIEFFEKNNRRVAPTARALGIHRRTLQRIIQRLGFDRTGEVGSKATALRRAKRMMRLWSFALFLNHKRVRFGYSHYRKTALRP